MGGGVHTLRWVFLHRRTNIFRGPGVTRCTFSCTLTIPMLSASLTLITAAVQRP